MVWGGCITWAGVIGKAQHASEAVQAVADRNVDGLAKYPVALLSIRYHLHGMSPVDRHALLFKEAWSWTSSGHDWRA